MNQIFSMPTSTATRSFIVKPAQKLPHHFRTLATLRTDIALFDDVDHLLQSVCG